MEESVSASQTRFEWARGFSRPFLAGLLVVLAGLTVDPARAGLDTDPPTITIISPLDGSIVTSATPVVAAAFSDEAQGTGVDPSATLLLVDSVDRTSEAQHDSFELRWAPGAALTEGTHLVSIYVEDFAGNGTTRSWSFTVDTVPPQVEMTPFPDPFPSQSAVIEGFASYSDAGSGVNVSTFGMVFSQGFGGLSACERGPSSATCQSPELKTGAYSVTASIRDLAGRLATDTVTLNLIIDTKGPEVRILAPEEGSVGNDPTIEVSGSVVDELDEVERVELNGVVIPHGNGTFAGEASLVEGPNLLTVVAFDRAGNSEASQVNVTLDSTAPTVSDLSPADGSHVGDSTPLVSAAFSDVGVGLDLALTQLLVDLIDRTAEATVSPTGIQWTSATPLEDGPHAIELHVVDDVGNVTVSNWSFGVDTTAPTVTDFSPADGSHVADSTPLVSAAFLDGGAGLDLALTQLLVDLVDRTAESTVSPTGIQWTPATPLEDGPHAVELHIVDDVGNVTVSSWSFSVDTTAPTVTDLSPADGSHVADSTPLVSAAFSDGGAGLDLALTQLLVDLVDRTAEATVSPTGIQWTSATPLEDGPHAVELHIVDDVGNVTVSSWGFSVDTTAPTVTDLSPADGSHVADSTPLVSAAFSDGGAGIDLPLTQLLVDLVDRTAEATVSATGIQWTAGAALADGSHAVELHVVDDVGNVTVSNWSFGVDTTAPSVTIDPFEDPFLSDSAVVSVSLSFLDGGIGGSGIDSSSLEIAIDGVPFEGSCNVLTATATCLTPPLVTGPHTIVASIADLVGNEGTDTEPLNVIVDVAAPVVEILTPVDGSYQNAATVEISGTVVDDGPLDRVELDGEPIVLVDGAFSVQKTLEVGSNLFTVVAVDMVGRPGLDSVVVRLDTGLPVLTIDEPTEGQLSNVPTIRVTGRADDPAGIALAAVGGVPVTLTNGRFDTQVPLAEGANVILIEATDGAGNLASTSRSVTYLAVPQVEITAPADLSWIADTAIIVEGTVTEGSTVTVNGVSTEVTGGTFTTIEEVPLIEGGNLITATAISTTGAAATDHVEVVRDLTAPTITLSTPVHGEVTSEAAIPVAGLVNDLVVGTVNASEVQIRINGVELNPDGVANRQFLLPSLALTPEANTITVEAQDQSGNLSTVAVTVYRREPTAERIEIVSGNLQTGVIETALAQPLVARVLDAVGTPAAGVPVVFRVEGGDGSLGNGQRSQVVTTDAAGLASATFELGEYAGAASQRVRAAAVGYGEVVFRATATPGSAVQIVADAGSQQLGTAGGSVPRPFVAAVTDAGSNRLEGVPVRFTVVKGNGHFGSSATEVVVPTDSDGRAITSFVLGTDDGTANNVVVAKIDGLPEGPSAAFVASGWAAGDPAATTIVGQVLDNQNEPVPGVTMRVKNDPLMRTAVADANGFFRMTSAPVGTVYLIADGSTATRPGAWADLEYVVTTVPGRENDLGRPVYLLPIDIGNGAYVSETLGGTVELEDYPGFALEIAPGSVTFPGGSRTGVISVTAVHSDRVPKTPNFGQQPQLIVTIQPAGARFDPPARMTLPNLEGLPPGRVTEMYSFDHDLSQFVAIGPATVSDDGTVITSNPGVGVIKAGWHAGGDPVPTGSACNCPLGLVCQDGRCVNPCPMPEAVSQSEFGETCPRPCDDGNTCTIGDHWEGDECVPGDRKEITFLEALANGTQTPLDVYVDDPVSFTADWTGPLCTFGETSFQWIFTDGFLTSEQNPTHAFSETGFMIASVEAECGNCDSEFAQVTVPVLCPEINIVEQTPNLTYTCPGCTVSFEAESDPPGRQIHWEIVDGDQSGKVAVSQAGTVSIAESAENGSFTVRAYIGSPESGCSIERSIVIYGPGPYPRETVWFSDKKYTRAEKELAKAYPACLGSIAKFAAKKCSNLRNNPAFEVLGPCGEPDPNGSPCPNRGIEGSTGNAFLHACWACESARIPVVCGPGGLVARMALGAHEDFSDNSCPQYSMDFQNNNIGFELAAQTGRECSELVLEAIEEGELYWQDPPDQGGDCPTEQYSNGQ